jgi:hypothetical protein
MYLGPSGAVYVNHARTAYSLINSLIQVLLEKALQLSKCLPLGRITEVTFLLLLHSGVA